MELAHDGKVTLVAGEPGREELRPLGLEWVEALFARSQGRILDASVLQASRARDP